jgi:AraC-like DNA-binding protein
MEQAKRPYRLKLVDVRIQILTRLIQSELHRDLRLEELAHSVNLSPSRLRHLFKHDTGQTLAQYVMCERLNRAQLLLRTTHLSVKEVMNQVGIGDPSHFARDFKKRFGISPTNCRQQKFFYPGITDHFSQQIATLANTSRLIGRFNRSNVSSNSHGTPTKGKNEPAT